ncbi:glutamine--fructose-6-phosphate transaminase (isomerizing) (plasmid) [Roseivivax marinus]|uniref:glutamine--fructose-6-phosphate transaminase (isomerizing) n=1 Tax=Roseivivax marinus TaxID=1379903 RepID=UPI001F03E5FE|nr:glutamine--fructose-6-phosphate transaminase (isomerizing) [Roseivivax marinus]UMA67208.1 glutamine--fructose-6-phosphate transaminase (isomerizing) [Roseivivax marinus]
MCGIIGILGQHQVAPLLVDGLRRLEYRGYDSAGIATIHEGRLARRRAEGKLVNLSDVLVQEPLEGTIGIGHTRWATHGAATTTNAHPHARGRVAVVHNGIIENYRNLQAFLASHNVHPESETDTETVALLCNWHLDQGLSPLDAVKRTIEQLEGAYALCFVFEAEPDLLIAARKGSPLAIGWGDGEMFVGSDAIALASMTTELTYLEEGDIAVLSRSGCTVLDRSFHEVDRERQTVDMDTAAIEKSGYKHFMAKEIAEQPQALSQAISHYVDASRSRILLPEGIDFTDTDRVSLVACGTASLACFVAKYWFEKIAGLPAEIDIASEFRYREPPMGDRAAAIFVSQSGETADTLAALRYCRTQGARIFSVVNVAQSSIARESDLALPILAGPEIGVASTKAFTCQLLVLGAMAVHAARQRGRIDAREEARLVRDLEHLPVLLSKALEQDANIQKIAADLARSEDVLFLGRGGMYPLALEGALKLKEVSYIHAEGYASGELKHGPIALVDESLPVVVLAPYDELFDKTLSNMQEVMARGGRIILVSNAKGIAACGSEPWKTIEMPDYASPFAPIVYAVPMQLIAYYTALAKGTDVDQPRNLAKSVTVE